MRQFPMNSHSAYNCGLEGPETPKTASARLVKAFCKPSKYPCAGFEPLGQSL